jgi:hypothetical protein
MFLGYEFSTYGVSAASFLEEQPEERIDPMSRVFPRSAYTDKKENQIFLTNGLLI